MEKYIVIDTIKQHPLELEHYPDYHDDSEVVLLAVKKNGLALQFASERLRNDRDVVAVAVQRNGLALQFASDALKQDKDIVTQAIQSNGAALAHVPAAFLHDRDLILAAACHCDAEQIPEEFLSDKEIAEQLIQHDHSAFHALSEELRSDIDLILEVIQWDGTMLVSVPDEVLANPEIAQELVATNAYAYTYLPDKLKQDREIALTALRSPGSTWAYEEMPTALRRDTEMMRTLVEHLSFNNDDEYRFASVFNTDNLPEELLCDDDFVSRLANIYECAEDEVEISRNLAIRMIRMGIFNEDLYASDLLDDPFVQDALELFVDPLPYDEEDDEEDYED